MNIGILVAGEGSVTGSGSYFMGDRAVLTATPSDGSHFSYFQIGGQNITDNPYIFNVPSNLDISINAVFIVTLDGYLKASVGFDLPDATLLKIRIDRGFSANQDIQSVSQRDRELAYADCLMYGATSPSQVQKAKESDNAWSHDAGSISLTPEDKRFMRRQANLIYKKYGEKVSPTIQLTSLNGGKVYGCANY